MAILGTITIVFNEIFVSDALIIFKRIFEARFAAYSGETLDRLQQEVIKCKALAL